MTHLSNLPDCIKNEFIYLFAGDMIASGMSRTVWHHNTDINLVIKIENSPGSFQNVTEWQVWQEVKDTKWAKWFAPCEYISHSGSVLIQHKVEPLQRKQLPDKLPAFFTDLKIDNYGMLNGKFVACDYGCNLLMSNGLSDRMKKAQW